MDNLMTAICEYMDKTCKKDYIMTEEEYLRLTRQLEILKKHIDIVWDYEIKKRG